MKNLIKYILLAFILVFSVSINTVNATSVTGKTGVAVKTNALAKTAKVLSLASAPDLKLGSVSLYVIKIQKYLNSHGYVINTNKGQAGSIGYEVDKFGVKTQQALIKFQKAKGINPANGYFNAVTKSKMVEEDTSKYIKGSDIPKGAVLGASTGDILAVVDTGPATPLDRSNYSSGSGADFSLTAVGNGHVDVQVVHIANGNPTKTYTTNPKVEGVVMPQDTLTLTAVPDEGYQVGSWNGDLPTSCQSMVAPSSLFCSSFAMGYYKRTINVSFVRKPVLLIDLLLAGNSSTSKLYISENGGEEREAVQEESFAKGTKIKLRAEPKSNNNQTLEKFRISWSDDCSSAASTSECELTMDEDKIATVQIDVPWGLKVMAMGDGAAFAKITSDPDENSEWDGGWEVVTVDQVTFSASTTDPKAAVFDGWSGECSGKGPCVINMNPGRDISLYANYTLRPMLQIQTVGNGSVSGAKNGDRFDKGTSVTLHAIPLNSVFTSWNGAGCTGKNDCTVVMYNNELVTANFTNQFKLNLSTNGNGTGSILGGADGKLYNQGDIVILTASSSLDSKFEGWGGGVCSGLALTCTVTMNYEITATAKFTKKQTYVLTTTMAGSAASSGKVLIGTMPISSEVVSNTVSKITYYEGEKVLLLPDPAALLKAKFDGWSGAGCSGTTNCIITMNYPQSVTASWSTNEDNKHKLKVYNSSTDGGSGVVTLTVNGASQVIDFSQGTLATINLNDGDSVSLAATPDASSEFGGWSNDCSGLGACEFTVSYDKYVTLFFIKKKIKYHLELRSESLDLVTAPINQNPIGTEFDAGTVVRLTATDDDDATFTNWSGECDSPNTGSNPCVVTMNYNKTVTAHFKKSDEYTNKHSLFVGITGYGTVRGVSDNFTWHNAGEIVGLVAVADATTTFSSWEGGGCSGTDLTCYVTMNENKTVKATFVPKTTSTTPKKKVNIKLSISGGSSAGTVSGLTGVTQSIEVGSDIILTANANTGYVFKKFTNCPKQVDNTCVLQNVQNASNIGVTFSPVPTYSMSFSPSLSGKASLMGGIKGQAPVLMTKLPKYPAGLDLEFVITPLTGYKINGISGCDTTSVVDNKTVCDIKTKNTATSIKPDIIKVQTVKLVIKVQNTSGSKGTVNYETDAGDKGATTESQTIVVNQGTKIVLNPTPSTNTSNIGERFLVWKNCVDPLAIDATDSDKCTWLGTKSTTITGSFSK